MNISEDAKLTPVTVAGIVVNIPEAFSEGHTLTEVEAKVLSQTFRENIRNNMASRIKAALEEDKKADCQQLVDDYIQSYSFGVRASGGGTVRISPLEKEVRKLALIEVKKLLVSKNMKVSEVPTEKLNEWRDTLIERNREAFEDTAQRMLDAAASIGDSELDLEL